VDSNKRDPGNLLTLVAKVPGVPLSADFTEETVRRSRDGISSAKQVARYRIYRDGRARVIAVSQGPQEGAPVFLVDTAGDAITVFDAESKTGYRLLMPGLGQDKRPFPLTAANPLHEFGGNQHFKSEDLGPVTANGLECVRRRLTITVEGRPELRHVDESCCRRLSAWSRSIGPRGRRERCT
jgi:hypothetical protein